MAQNSANAPRTSSSAARRACALRAARHRGSTSTCPSGGVPMGPGRGDSVGTPPPAKSHVHGTSTKTDVGAPRHGTSAQATPAAGRVFCSAARIRFSETARSLVAAASDALCEGVARAKARRAGPNTSDCFDASAGGTVVFVQFAPTLPRQSSCSSDRPEKLALQDGAGSRFIALCRPPRAERVYKAR
jgi:hypothetical protein